MASLIVLPMTVRHTGRWAPKPGQKKETYEPINQTTLEETLPSYAINLRELIDTPGYKRLADDVRRREMTRKKRVKREK